MLKKKIIITIAREFFANNVVKIEILIKNIGTGGTPAIAKIETKETTRKVGKLVKDWSEFKKTILFRLKFSITRTRFKNDNK